MTRTSLDGFYHRKVLRGNEIVEGSFLLEELKLTDREMLRWDAVSSEVTRSDAAQLDASAETQYSSEYYKRLGHSCLNEEKASSSDSSDDGSSP